MSDRRGPRSWRIATSHEKPGSAHHHGLTLEIQRLEAQLAARPTIHREYQLILWNRSDGTSWVWREAKSWELLMNQIALYRGMRSRGMLQGTRIQVRSRFVSEWDRDWR